MAIGTMGQEIGLDGEQSMSEFVLKDAPKIINEEAAGTSLLPPLQTKTMLIFIVGPRLLHSYKA